MLCVEQDRYTGRSAATLWSKSQFGQEFRPRVGAFLPRNKARSARGPSRTLGNLRDSDEVRRVLRPQEVLSSRNIMLSRLCNLSPATAQKMNLAGDVVILIAASFVAAHIDGEIHWDAALAMSILSAALWLAASRLLRHYDVWNGRGFLNDVALTLVLFAAVAAPMALLRLVSPRYVGVTDFRLFLVVLLPAVMGLRLRAVGHRLWQARQVEQVLVVGVGSLGRITHREIRDRTKRRNVIGYLRFDDEEATSRLGAPVFGTIGDLEKALCERVVDEIYFASGAPHHATDLQTAIRTCERFGVPFALPICGFRMARARPACAKAVRDGYVHYLSVPCKPLQAGVKRLSDIVLSAAGIVVLAPLLGAVALLVKLTSRGPILFRQERVGQYGRRFHMLKFRSMVKEAEALKSALLQQNEQSGPVFKMQRDPRVTRLGRFMRRYSIDELPQLLNVLRGDMSIVGPRPPLASEVSRYQSWQRRRLSVRPGLTCLWQVSGRNHISFEQWMLLDMRYIDHWSLAQDLGLILRTAPAVLTGRGAS
jgi:exopolysaccharide biosynthesis polyprenyl glycosylphosphotransferase